MLFKMNIKNICVYKYYFFNPHWIPNIFKTVFTSNFRCEIIFRHYPLFYSCLNITMMSEYKIGAIIKYNKNAHKFKIDRLV